MGIGHEIIKEQLFFKKELKERVYWFIKLRWAVAAAGGVCLLIAYSLGLKLTYWPLGLIICSVGVYNLIFYFVGKWLDTSRAAEVRPFQVFAHVQIALDLFALYLIIFFTGGPASPLLIFVILHVVLAGILLSALSCFIYAILVLAALGELILLEQAGLTPAWAVWLDGSLFFYTPHYTGALIPYLTFAACILIAAYLTTSIKAALRSKGRELMKASGELEVSNTKLTSLYEMIKEVGSHSKYQVLMDSATRNAARIMGVKACSIKLLDPQKECLRFASTYGLSEDYLSKDCISIDKSPINRRIIEGSVYSTGQIDEESYFQYPEDIRKEGIASMLCLPLKVAQKTLGVFCVYSGEPNRFSESDADFFSLVTDLTALDMEKMSRDMAKTWFLNKAAHQFRSPLNAVQSMLHLITGGYLGQAEDKQKETILRCEKRISILQEVINDLLKLASERQETDRPPLYPIDLAAVLNALAPSYKAQAAEKGLSIEFYAEESLPKVLGEERLVDELFSNLISNAIKYTSPGGRVSVRVDRASPDTVRVEVKDTGIGIPELELPRLFSEFFRGENAKALVEEGTGLGLVIVKEISDRLGGTLKVESKLGQGTRICCLIPVLSDKADQVV